jgi:hypothetical protein
MCSGHDKGSCDLLPSPIVRIFSYVKFMRIDHNGMVIDPGSFDLICSILPINIFLLLRFVVQQFSPDAKICRCSTINFIEIDRICLVWRNGLFVKFPLRQMAHREEEVIDDIDDHPSSKNQKRRTS